MEDAKCRVANLVKEMEEDSGELALKKTTTAITTRKVWCSSLDYFTVEP